MLTATDTPDSVSFTRNPVEFRLRATDDGGTPYGPAGATAEVTMNSFGLRVDDTLTVDWEEADGSSGSVTFTAKATPNMEGEVEAQPSGLGDFEYFETIAGQMQAHPHISPFFTVTADSPSSGTYRLTFSALDTSAGFTVSLDIQDIDEISSADADSTAAVADNTPDDYAIIFDVFFEAERGSDSFEKVASLEARPDADGYVLFNIQSVLHAQARLSIDEGSLPDLSLAPVVVQADTDRRYYCRWREDYATVFDDPMNTDGDWQSSNVLNLLTGGISQALWSGVDFLGSIDATNSFLTWYPDKKPVSPSQPEFLPWYNFAAGARQLRIEIKTTTADGTTNTFSILDTTDFTIRGKSFGLIPAGLYQIETAKGESFPDVVKYTVQVVDLDSVTEAPPRVDLSPVRTFYVDRSRYEELRYVTYLNSFYCPLTLRCVGVLSKQLEVDAQESARILLMGYADGTAEKFVHDTDWENPRTYRSGHLGKLEADALQELLIYRMAWEIRASGYTALFITAKRFNITETLQHLHSIEFEAVRALRPINYSGLGEVTVETENFWELEGSGLFELQNSTGFWKLETT